MYKVIQICLLNFEYGVYADKPAAGTKHRDPGCHAVGSEVQDGGLGIVLQQLLHILSRAAKTALMLIVAVLSWLGDRAACRGAFRGMSVQKKHMDYACYCLYEEGKDFLVSITNFGYKFYIKYVITWKSTTKKLLQSHGCCF